MSEFTNYMQFQTEAESLVELRGQIERSIGSAELPLNVLPFGAIDSEADAEAAWSALPKPVWVMLGSDGEIADLAKAGPAFHLMVEEDFQSWALAVGIGQNPLVLVFLRQPEAYREMTSIYSQTQNYDKETHGAELAQLADYFNVESAALEKTFIPDGGQSFSALIGAPYEQMEDLSAPGLAPGQVIFPFDN